MVGKLMKVAAKDIRLQPVTDPPQWAGTRIAEIFDTTGRTRMACGIHEIFQTEVVSSDRDIDDVLYILEGQIEIRVGDHVEVFREGDFAYVAAAGAVTYIVKDRVKLIYVVYPANWKTEK